MSYGAYRWVPLESAQETLITDEDCLRLKKFIEAYGLHESAYPNLIPMMVKRLAYMIAFITHAAESGEANFQTNIQDGHTKKYEQDIHWLLENEEKILKELQRK